MNTKKYIGKQFKDKGRGPDSFDCYGLIRSVYKNELDIELTNYLGYESTTDAFNIPLIVLKERQKWQQVQKPKEYDIAVLNINGRPLHVGIMIDTNKFMHISKGICVCVESINSNMWKNRINGYFRYSK